MIVYSQVALQAVFIAFTISFFLLAAALASFLSLINTCAAQVALAFSSLIGIFESTRGEYLRYQIRKSGLSQQSNQPEINLTEDLDYITSNSTNNGRHNSTVEPLINHSQSIQHIPHQPTYGYSIDISRDNVNKKTVLFFSALLLLVNYAPIPLNIVFGFMSMPGFQQINETLSLSTASNLTSTSLYEGIGKIPYYTEAKYDFADNYDFQRSSVDIFDDILDSSSGNIVGSSIYQAGSRENGYALCGLYDHLEQLLLQVGTVSDFLMEKVPMIPRISCVYTDMNSSVPFTVSYNSSENNVTYNNIKLSKIPLIGENFTTIGISYQNSSIYTSTIHLLSQNFEFSYPKNLSEYRDFFQKGLKAYKPESDDEDVYYGRFNNLTQTGEYWNIRKIDYLHEVCEDAFTANESFIASYTTKLSSNNPYNNYSRVIISFSTKYSIVQFSELFYSTRSAQYPISSIDEKFKYQHPVTYFTYGNETTDPFDIEVFPPVSNMKVSPILAATLKPYHGITIDELETLTYLRKGRLGYSITAVFSVFIAACGGTVLLLLISILFGAHRIPIYYDLLHEYHQTEEGDCARSLFTIVKPAFFGKAFLEGRNVNRIGLHSEMHIKTKPKPGHLYD